MKLIAESTSKSTEWALVEGSQLAHRFTTEGINPFFQTRRDISRSIRLSLPLDYFKHNKVKHVYYYGVGCSTANKRNIVEASLIAQFRTPVNVESNMLGAARGLFRSDTGIACILGMDTNTCLYDGTHIVKNICPGGYLLGDEGSEAVLGKLFLADLIKELMPISLLTQFYDSIKLDRAGLLRVLYDEPNPARYLSDICGFLLAHSHEEYVNDLIVKNFKDLFRRNIRRYDYKKHKIRFVGSAAVNFKEQLLHVAHEYDAHVDLITDSFLTGLIEYHAES